MKKSQVEDIHWNVLTHFLYTPDKVIHPDFFDHWQSHADEVERGQTFRDDCDGFALTCAEILIRKGAESKDVKLIYCKTETGGAHLVASWESWILDNRQRFPMYWENIPYEWIKSMRLSEKGIWRKMS